METLRNRIYQIAKIYNVSNAEWLVKMVLESRRIKRAIKFNYPISDNDIHDEVYYYEENYNGDCFEDACYYTKLT